MEAEKTIYIDIIDFFKRELKLIILVMVIFMGCFCIYQYFFNLRQYETSMLIKMPQYISRSPDMGTAMKLADETVTESTKNINDSEVFVHSSSINDSTIFKITFSGPSPEVLTDYIDDYKTNLLPILNNLSKERFVYNWQINNAQSAEFRDYNKVKESIILDEPQILNDDLVVKKVSNKKQMIIMGFISFVLGLCFAIIHYLYKLKSKS
jgi:capsular polysaccharide biosynthesis protein